MLWRKYVRVEKERLLREGNTHAKNQGCVELTRAARYPIPDRAVDNGSLLRISPATPMSHTTRCFVLELSAALESGLALGFTLGQ